MRAPQRHGTRTQPGASDPVQRSPAAPPPAAALSRQAGTVTVTYGSPSGKAAKDSGSAKPQQRTLREGHDGLPEQAEPNDRFGAGLLTGDLDGDGCTDRPMDGREPGRTRPGRVGKGAPPKVASRLCR